MPFARVYPECVANAERKGRTMDEVDEIIEWLTSYDDSSLSEILEQGADIETFVADAPALNPSRVQIKGVICDSASKTSKRKRCVRSAISTSSSTNWLVADQWTRSCVGHRKRRELNRSMDSNSASTRCFGFRTSRSHAGSRAG